MTIVENAAPAWGDSAGWQVSPAPLHVGGDWVLGVRRDELDVERVRLYRLVRSPRIDGR